MTADAWIAVTDRLPDSGQRVMCYCKTYKEHEVRICKYTKGRWNPGTWLADGSAITSTEVTHWQPLPAPPDAASTESENKA